MAIYAIGDIQGCYDPLMRLLEHIEFDSAKDTLWFTGDLVNRGPQSLEVLRFIKNLKHKVTVLGNHDLHLLALAHHAHKGWKDDTLQSILEAPDREELITWLRQQPLLHHEHDFTLVHAGLAASWDLATAQTCAQEISTTLQSSDAQEFFKHMYGNEPTEWQESLTGWDRLRCITNYFTRQRFCYPNGQMELHSKGTLQQHASEQLIPWFQVANRRNKNLKIIFGHWAALGGVTHTENVFALDTGCVWGYSLTAMCLEDGKRYQVSCG